jgi:hypothetical protein
LWQKLVGSAAFALLALAFLLQPLGSALVIEGDGQKVYDFLVNYRTWIVTGGIVFALFDLLAIKSPRHHK